MLGKTTFSWTKIKQVPKIILFVVRGYFPEFLVFFLSFFKREVINSLRLLSFFSVCRENEPINAGNRFYPIHTEIFAPKSNEINFIPVRDCWLLVGRFLSLVKNIVRPITGHGRLFVTSEENRRALSVFSQRLASNGELFFISRQIKWHQDLRI